MAVDDCRIGLALWEDADGNDMGEKDATVDSEATMARKMTATVAAAVG